MHSGIDRQSRRVIPRWRLASDTSVPRYSEGSKLLQPVVKESDLERIYRDWEVDHNPNAAIELAIALDAFGSDLPISRSRIEQEFKAKGDCDIALRIINRGESTNLISNSGSNFQAIPNIGEQISLARASTKKEPNNPFAWLSMARCYTLLGLHSKKQCEKAISIASALAPSNRYVARAAARYYIHRNLPDLAISTLLRSGRVKHDPWLASALVASREIAKLPQKSIRTYVRLANNLAWSDFSRSELLAGIASLEVKSGSVKSAKKIFRSVLKDPTENALAQAQWFSIFYKQLEIPDKTFLDTKAYEAIENKAFREGDWGRVIESSLAWQRLEPFSKRPALNGTMVALSVLEDSQSALELIKPAYVANKSDPLVANNHAVSLIYCGQLVEAERVLEEAIKDGRKTEIASLQATMGLLSFRYNQLELGRQLYEGAIDIFEMEKDNRNQFICSLYWAREEIIAGEKSRAAKLVSKAKDKYRGYPNDKLALAILETVDRKLK